MRFKGISLLGGCGVGEGLSQEHKGLTRHENQHDCSPVTRWLPTLNEEGRPAAHLPGFSTSQRVLPGQRANKQWDSSSLWTGETG